MPLLCKRYLLCLCALLLVLGGIADALPAAAQNQEIVLGVPEWWPDRNTLDTAIKAVEQAQNVTIKTQTFGSTLGTPLISSADQKVPDLFFVDTEFLLFYDKFK